MASSSTKGRVDAVPGRMCWVKYATFPWWPARFCSKDEIPQKVQKSLFKDVEYPQEGHTLVKFFEDPPTYQYLELSKFRPWYQDKPKIVKSAKKSEPFAKALR